MAADPLVPTKTPFNFNIGINYDPGLNGRNGRSITADLDQITQFFDLIKTFQDVAVPDATNPTIDPDEQQVINYVTNNPNPNLQMVMGTYTSALALGGYGAPWSGPGMMTDPAYTDKWVAMIIQAFGGVDEVKDHLKMILLGNEVDQDYNHPPDVDTYLTWFGEAFTNLSASLQKAGLGSLPISTTIAGYGPDRVVAVGATDYIQSHWSNAWNGGTPTVLFNQYTPSIGPDFGKSTDYQSTIGYFNYVESQLGAQLEPFVGETGYSSIYGVANEVNVFNQINSWLTGQFNNNNHMTVPLFIFNAFDQPSRSPPVETSFGIFDQNSQFQPTGLKPFLTLPSWTNDSFWQGGTGAPGTVNQLVGGDGSDMVTYAGNPGTVLVDLRAQAGYVGGVLTDQFTSIENATGGSGGSVLIGDDGDNFLLGGSGTNVLYGLGGDDVLQGGAAAAGAVNQLWGGDGNDTASYATTTGTVYADLRIQAGLVNGVLTDEMNSIENLVGGSGVNTLVGDDGNNVLTGGANTDYLYGEAGNDVLIGGGAPAGTPNQLWGGAGSDTASYAGTLGNVYADLNAQAGYVNNVLTDQMNSIENLTGGAGNDTLIGNAGPNVLTGGQGADVLWGKGGADTFAYTSYADSNLITGYDTVADFVTGTSKLDLSALATDASHVVIDSGAASTNLYVEHTPGTFNASTDLAISFVGPNAIQISDIKF